MYNRKLPHCQNLPVEYRSVGFFRQFSFSSFSNRHFKVTESRDFLYFIRNSAHNFFLKTAIGWNVFFDLFNPNQICIKSFCKRYV